MEYKWRCACGKRFRTPVSVIGKHRACPKCGEDVEVPAFSSDRALAVYCDCGEELPPLTLHCPKCGKDIIAAVRGAEDEEFTLE